METLLKNGIALCVTFLTSATLAWAYADCFFDGAKCLVRAASAIAQTYLKARSVIITSENAAEGRNFSG